MEVMTNATLQYTVSHLGPTRQALVTLVYFLGVIGNLAALGYLYRSETAPRNPRHSLVLRCLALNDLTAVLGMWVQMNLKMHVPALATSQWFCVFRVVWRSFGLGSGCIVCVMAIDRWIALTRPFFYQKYVTLGMIKKSIIALWLADFILVCMPFFGFGLYYKHDTGICARYKEAEKPIDIAYAYLYCAFGFLLCLCLVFCNLAVMRALTKPKPSKQQFRRISRNRDFTRSTSTNEEVAFAKVMGLLCAIFVACWVPQFVTIPAAQLYPNSPKCKTYMKLADIIMALHFIIDPYFYTLQRMDWCKNWCKKNQPSRINSVKTSNVIENF